MKILSLELREFIPLLYNNIHKLSITFSAPVQIIIGDNGSGKSSLMRELTPLPSKSTNFKSNGYKCITIEHNNHTYILTSDYSKPRAHSFLCDNNELNESGTTQVQRELVSTHFNVDNIAYALLSHKLKITELRPFDRRDFFFKLYPSNFEFILTDAKRLNNRLKNLRAIAGNLQKNITDEKSHILTPDTIKNYNTQLTELYEHIEQLTMTISQFTHEQNEIIRAQQQLPKVPSNIQTLLRQCSNIHDEVTTLHNTHTSLSLTNIPEQLHVLTTLQSMQSEQLNRLHDELLTLTSELRDYEEATKINIHEEISDVKKQIKGLTKTITKLQHLINPEYVNTHNISALQELQLLFSNLLPKLNNSYHWSENTIIKADALVKQWEYELQLLSSKLQSLNTEYHTQEKQYKHQLSIHPNVKCKLSCKLKTQYQSITNDLKTRVEELHSECIHLETKIKKMEKRLERLKTLLESHWSDLPIISQLDRAFSSLLHMFPSSFSTSLIFILNHDYSKLTIFLQNAITHTTNATALAECQQERDDLTIRLHTLNQLKQTLTVTSQSILALQQSHTVKSKEYSTIKKQLQEIKTNLNALQAIQKYNEQLPSIKKQLENYFTSKQYELGNIILTDWISELTNLKRQLVKQATELENIIDQQNHITSTITKLQSMLKQTNDDITLGTIVQQALNPYSGLPAEYMLRLINPIILKVNEFIKSIWNYEMELEPKTHLSDYAFPVIINHKGGIKDINVCSQGQQTIINLAFILSIGIIMKHITVWPLRLDEPDQNISTGTRIKIFEMLSNLINEQHIQQLFLINHHEALYTAFQNAEILCLDPTNIITPVTYNQHCTIE